MFKVNNYENEIARQTRMEAAKETRNSQHWSVLEAWIAELGLESGVGAEIGVMRGWNTFHQLNRYPNLSMIMVDQWKVIPDTGEEGWDNLAHIDQEFQAWYVKKRAGKFNGRATVIHADSVEAALQVDDASLDFIFIDADHTYRGCTGDIKAWVPKLKPAGWVMGHDCDRKEVRQALDELLPGWGTPPPSRECDKTWRISRAQVAW